MSHQLRAMNRDKFFTLALFEDNRFLSHVCSGWGIWAVLQDERIILTLSFVPQIWIICRLEVSCWFC